MRLVVRYEGVEQKIEVLVRAPRGRRRYYVGRSFDASANERPRQKGSFEEEGKAIEPILASAASRTFHLTT